MPTNPHIIFLNVVQHILNEGAYDQSYQERDYFHHTRLFLQYTQPLYIFVASLIHQLYYVHTLGQLQRYAGFAVCKMYFIL